MIILKDVNNKMNDKDSILIKNVIKKLIIKKRLQKKMVNVYSIIM